MNGLAYEADYIVAWPTAEIAVMGPDGAVNIIHRKQLEAIDDDDERAARAPRVGRGDPGEHRPVHRGRSRPARRRDRSRRHPGRDRARPADHRRQAGRPSVAQARRPAGVNPCDPTIRHATGPTSTTCSISGAAPVPTRAPPTRRPISGASSTLRTRRSSLRPTTTASSSVRSSSTFDAWRGNFYRMAVDPGVRRLGLARRLGARGRGLVACAPVRRSAERARRGRP